MSKSWGKCNKANITGRETELLPCPFCGSVPEMKPWHGGRPTKMMVSCENFECSVAPSAIGETPEEAVYVWNRRAPSERDEFAKIVLCLKQRGLIPDTFDAANLEAEDA